MGKSFDIDLTEYVPFEHVTDEDLQKARIFNKCRMSETGCWLWTGSKGSGGYGVFSSRNVDQRAHRASYILFKRPIPKGLHVLHRCDTPACVNPAHLRVGTVRENVADREARQRRSVAGEQIGTSKLISAEVIDIMTSPLKSGVLAKKYGISRHSVWQIRTGKRWKHLTGAIGLENVDGN